MVDDPSCDSRYDAVIIGAGIVGASVALGLSRKGLKTLNIDTLPASGYGSTSNSSAIIRPFYSAVENCALAHEARHRWQRWRQFLAAPDERGYAVFDECGMLVLVAQGDEGQFEASLRAMREVGVGFEYLGPQQLGERCPGLDLASFGPPKLPDDAGFGVADGRREVGGYLIPQAGYVNDPQLAAHNLQRAAEALGAGFMFNTRVEAIERNGGRVSGVRTGQGGLVEAPVVVNAAGPHSAHVNSLAGVAEQMALATRPERHEVAHLSLAADREPRSLPCVIGDGDSGVYLRPETGGNLLVGSLDPACDGRDYVDADDYNSELTEQWTRQVWRAALRIPSLSIPNAARGVVGLYDTTPDWIPIYDKSSLPGFYMAVGTSGNQFKNAPVIGDLMAELICACESGRDHDSEPVDFYLPALGRTIGLGFYSRNRALHSETSGTVLA